MRSTPVPDEKQRRWRVWVSPHDSMRWLTWISGGGLIAAVVLAVAGGLPFDLPMPTHSFGWVDPTCGLTRGSTAIARGDFGTAWHYNPLSFVVMALGVSGVVRAIVGIIARRWVNIAWRPQRFVWALASVALIGLWLYQQTNAEFIINSRS